MQDLLPYCPSKYSVGELGASDLWWRVNHKDCKGADLEWGGLTGAADLGNIYRLPWTGQKVDPKAALTHPFPFPFSISHLA